MQINSYGSSGVNYNNTLQNQQKIMLKMATAQRINKAADDAAGLGISEGMRGQISGLNQAQRNIQDSVSLLKVAEGGMSGSSDVMQRMRELTVQAGNGTLTNEDRRAIQMEMNQLGAQIDSNAANTQYNGMSTNDGSMRLITQSGANSGQNTLSNLGDTSAAALGIKLDVSTRDAAEAALSSVDVGISGLSKIRSNNGASINGLETSANAAASSSLNLQSSESKLRDADMAKEATLFAASGINLYANIMALTKTMQQRQGVLSILA